MTLINFQNCDLFDQNSSKNASSNLWSHPLSLILKNVDN